MVEIGYEGAIFMHNTKKMITLDKKNEIILQMLIENARTPLSIIAKRVRLSKAGVLKRINKLKEDEVIYDFVPITNPLAWNYECYVVLFSIDSIHEDQDIRILKKSPFLWSLFRLSGTHSFFAIFTTRNRQIFNKEWGSLAVSIHLKQWKRTSMVNYGFQPYSLFGAKSGLIKKSHAYESKDLDATDAEILNVIKFDARVSLQTIMNNTNINTDKIKRRLKALYDRGAIQRYFANFDIYSLGLMPYLLTLNLKDTRAEDRITSYLQESDHSNGVLTLTDEWSIMAIVEFHDLPQMRSFIETLLKKFPEIAHYETSLILDQIVCDMFPSGVYGDFKK